MTLQNPFLLPPILLFLPLEPLLRGMRYAEKKEGKEREREAETGACGARAGVREAEEGERERGRGKRREKGKKEGEGEEKGEKKAGKERETREREIFGMHNLLQSHNGRRDATLD